MTIKAQLSKYKRLLKTLDLSERGTKEERMRAHYEMYKDMELLRKRANTVLLVEK